MDHIDRQLLALLQKNARTPLKVLAEQVFLSAPAVSARIEKLEAQGILIGYQAKTDPQRLGYALTAIISIEPDSQKQEELIAWLDACCNVTECWLITGPCSVMARAVFADTRGLELFLQNLHSFGTASAQIVLSEPVPSRGIHTEYEKE